MSSKEGGFASKDYYDSVVHRKRGKASISRKSTGELIVGVVVVATALLTLAAMATLIVYYRVGTLFFKWTD